MSEDQPSKFTATAANFAPAKKQSQPLRLNQVFKRVRLETSGALSGRLHAVMRHCIQAAMKDFLAWSEHEHAAKPGTHTRYEVSSKPLKLYFRDARIDETTPEDVEKYKQHRARKKSPFTERYLRPATINRELACLKILFNRFIKDDVIFKNPVSRVKFLAENNEQMRVLTMEEQQTYLLAASQPLRDVARLMLETGMRRKKFVASGVMMCTLRKDTFSIRTARRKRQSAKCR